jgi:hypothetical protein
MAIILRIHRNPK